MMTCGHRGVQSDAGHTQGAAPAGTRFGTGRGGVGDGRGGRRRRAGPSAHPRYEHKADGADQRGKGARDEHGRAAVPPPPPIASSSGATVGAAFATKRLWVTRSDPAERYPAGDFVNQHPCGAGLPAYTAADRDIDVLPLTVWHTPASPTRRAPGAGRSCRSTTLASHSSRSASSTATSRWTYRPLQAATGPVRRAGRAAEPAEVLWLTGLLGCALCLTAHARGPRRGWLPGRARRRYAADHVRRIPEGGPAGVPGHAGGTADGDSGRVVGDVDGVSRSRFCHWPVNSSSGVVQVIPSRRWAERRLCPPAAIVPHRSHAGWPGQRRHTITRPGPARHASAWVHRPALVVGENLVSDHTMRRSRAMTVMDQAG
ncbi:hypothetical protein ACIHCV_32260 [Streptomyces sp. NPDC051956]|uniref:copper amine oxidase n=1 Tax=Streptomyces sp. NPDC051956 TaxID=3365677 RepID=UPI0037CDA338